MLAIFKRRAVIEAAAGGLRFAGRLRARGQRDNFRGVVWRHEVNLQGR